MLGAGSDFRRSWVFRLIYLPLALVYLGLVLFWGRHDLFRVQREYREVGGRLAGGYVWERAEREVADGCRQAVGGEAVPGYGECLRSSQHLVEARAAVLTDELRREHRRAGKKMIVFYLLVGVGMIMLPLAAIYVFLVFFRYLLTSIRGQKE